MRNSRARTTAAGLVFASATAVVAAAVLPSAHATSSVATDRFAGATRYDTARLIATSKAPGASTFAFGSPTQAVLVSGDNFPDALAASFLAGAYKSPTFLTAAGSLRPEAVQGMHDLGIKKVTIVGGSLAVSPAEDAALNAESITPTRIQGANRDDTAAMVAQAPGTAVGTYKDQGLTALLAADNVDHYVDALAAGPLAWSGHLPVLLTGTDALAPEAKGALTALKIKHVVILGGTAAVSGTVESAVASLGISTERLQGANRQLTAIAIANAEAQFLGFAFTHIYLAVGNNFPDALAGGPVGGLGKAPVVLTSDTSTLGADTKTFLTANDGAVNSVTAFGGTNAIADSVLAEASSSAVCNSATTTSTTKGLLGAPAIRGGAAVADVTTTTSTTTPGSTTSTTGGSTTSTTLAPCRTTTTFPPTSSTAGGSTTSTTAVGGTTSTTKLLGIL